MGIFSRVNAASKLTLLMHQSDAVVQQLTGVPPKQLHPRLYGHLLDRVKEYVDELERAGAPPLEVEEAALIKITVLLVGSREAISPHPTHQPRVYQSAINHLLVKSEAKIRPELTVSLFLETENFGRIPAVPDDCQEPDADLVANSPPKASSTSTVDAINSATGVNRKPANTKDDVLSREKSPFDRTSERVAEREARLRKLRDEW